MAEIKSITIGDCIVFRGYFGEDPVKCTVTRVSVIVNDPLFSTFKGITDSGRDVGGYFDQIVEIVQVPRGT